MVEVLGILFTIMLLFIIIVLPKSRYISNIEENLDILYNTENLDTKQKVINAIPIWSNLKLSDLIDIAWIRYVTFFFIALVGFDVINGILIQILQPTGSYVGVTRIINVFTIIGIVIYETLVALATARTYEANSLLIFTLVSPVYYILGIGSVNTYYNKHGDELVNRFG